MCMCRCDTHNGMYVRVFVCSCPVTSIHTSHMTCNKDHVTCNQESCDLYTSNNSS